MSFKRNDIGSFILELIALLVSGEEQFQLKPTVQDTGNVSWTTGISPQFSSRDSFRGTVFKTLLRTMQGFSPMKSEVFWDSLAREDRLSVLTFSLVLGGNQTLITGF